ncbi:MAG: hypothetical protein SGJ11_06680 [Phycisphaerae bacterium]|nr:hypothetical protein [Phycisphaerae bacterium]
MSLSLVQGAMFILPLAIASPVLGQGTANAATEGSMKSTGGETFTVQFQDTDILQALQMLSIQGQRNIIAGKGVNGTVTANLFDVTVQEALDVILKATDHRYEEVGNFIYVYTRDEWEQMQQARRKKESRRFTLDYLSAKDANEFVQPLISEVGKVAFMGNTEKGVAPDPSNAGEDSWAFQAMLVVNDYPENLQAIADFLLEVDTPPMQVLVESTIVSTRVNEDNAWGVDFSIIGNVDFANFTNPLSAVNNLIAGNNEPDAKADDTAGFQPADNRAIAGGTSVGRTSEPGGLKVGFINDNVSAFLRVLDEVTDTMILARPRATALNRQRAQILVGERVGYLSTTQTETTATQTVEYLDTGIKLIFRPFISKNGSIRMELAPSVSEAVLRQVTGASGGGVVIPDEKTNEIMANVRLQDGQTLVLGGLFQEKTTMSRRQVPGLGDIPFLGAAFKGQDDKIERNEIIFLITPTIMKDAISATMGQDGQAFAEAVRVGAREGLLPWSRDALSANHNQDAMSAAAGGDTEKALYHTEASLRLNKNQPEMVILRSELDASKPSKAFERDMMQRIIDKRSMTKLQVKADAAAAAAASAPPVTDPLAQPATAVAQVAPEAGEFDGELPVADNGESGTMSPAMEPQMESTPDVECETDFQKELESDWAAESGMVEAQQDETIDDAIATFMLNATDSTLASPQAPPLPTESSSTADSTLTANQSAAISPPIYSFAAALRTPFGLPWLKFLNTPTAGVTSSSSAIATGSEHPGDYDGNNDGFMEMPE